MTITAFEIEGLKLIAPRVFGDSRGRFFESYHANAFAEAGLPTHFVQDNQSVSARGTFRGLHLQAPPHGQGKLVRVARGAALDIALDVRRHSPTFGQHVAVELTEHNDLSFWVPEGFAHGFLALEESTVFQYKCTGYYHKPAELGLRWNDPALKLTLPFEPSALSEKDLELPGWHEFTSPY